MSRRAALWVVGLTAILSVVAPLKAQEQPLRGLPDLRPPAALFGEPFVLKIERPEGICYVRLHGQVDGPVRLPLPEETGLKALQVATELGPGDRVAVALSAVESELFITPVSSYELSGREDEVLHLAELAAYGLSDWSLSLATAPEPASDCCLCGNLGCCPRAGKCLTCGDCGDCCLVK